jgi:LysR family transcriptional regulator, low CO2-responsive transcriptional regulator
MPQSKIRRYLRHGMLPHLSVFEAVARLGSFTRAGEELHMAQPTVSVQIRKLTETIGLPLLEQVGKTVRLTSVGKELQAASDEIFQALTRFEQKVSDTRGLQSGTLDIMSSSVAEDFTSRLLVDFAKDYPTIDVRMHVGQRPALLERIAANTDDLYLMTCPPSSDDVVSLRLLADPVVVLARRDHPLAGQTNIPFTRLATEPLLVQEAGSEMRMITDRLFGQHGLKPKVRMELGSNKAIHEALVGGLGVSIMPGKTAGEGMDSTLIALNIEGFPVESYWYLVYPIGKQLSFIAQTFLDFVRKEVQRQGRNFRQA